MELFLNLAWLSISLLLVITWMRSERSALKKFKWSTVIALLLLLVLLFPVISMTDDLIAINMASEVEHTMRRYEAPPSQTVAILDAIILMAMIMIGVALSGTSSTRIRPRSFAAKLLAGFVRASGVRPPPVVIPLAA